MKTIDIILALLHNQSKILYAPPSLKATSSKTLLVAGKILYFFTVLLTGSGS